MEVVNYDDKLQEMSACRTMPEAMRLAQMIAGRVETFKAAAKFVSMYHVSEYLPDEMTIQDEPTPALRDHIAIILVRRWKEQKQAEFLDQAVAAARADLRSKMTRARMCLGLSDANAKHMLATHLARWTASQRPESEY